MKRKLFCLLTLLLTVCSGVWAAAATTTDNKTATGTINFASVGTLTSSTTYWYNGLKFYDLGSTLTSDNSKRFASQVTTPGYTTVSSGSKWQAGTYSMSGLAMQAHCLAVNIAEACTINVLVNMSGSTVTLGNLKVFWDGTAYDTNYTTSNYNTGTEKTDTTWTKNNNANNWILSIPVTAEDLEAKSIDVIKISYTGSRTDKPQQSQCFLYESVQIVPAAAATKAETPIVSSMTWNSETSKYDVTLTCGTANSTIKYIIDKTGLQTHSDYSEYTTTLHLSQGQTLDAYAIADDLDDSDDMEQMVAPYLYSLTYDIGDGTGISPVAMNNIASGTKVTLPKNCTMYKEGHTFSGWDIDGNGSVDYAGGSTYEVTANKTLTAVFAENTTRLSARSSDVTIKWNFGPSNGVPALLSLHAKAGDPNEGFVVAQAIVNGSSIDVKLPINATSGKFDNSNRNDQWAQVNENTTFTIPSVKGATITYNLFTGGEQNIDVNVDGDTYVYTVTDNNYYEYIQVVLPAASNPSEVQPVYDGEAITWDFSTKDAQTAALNGATFLAGADNEPHANTLYATDETSTIVYMAGSSDDFTYSGDNYYLKSNSNTKNNTRYFILPISSNGTLSMTAISQYNTYAIHKAANASTAWASTTDTEKTITVSSETKTASVNITYDAEKPYLYIGFPSGKIYTQKIVWTPASDDVTMTTSVNMAGWRSFVDATQAYTIKEGETSTKAYIVTSVGANVVLSEYDGTIYKNMPVLLKTDRGDRTIVLTKYESNESYDGSNKLKATTAGTSYSNILRLGYGAPASGGVGVGFYPYSTDSAPAGVVYLDLDDSTDARALSIVFDDEETTGISEVRGLKAEVRGEFYDLSGRKVAQPTKGLYIVNGRKVVIK